MSKKDLTFVERNLNELRKEINIVTEDELKAKNYVCTFSDKTHKLTSIKSTNETNKSEEHYKKVFYLLIEDLYKYCDIKISLTESDRLRNFKHETRIPKPKTRKTNPTKNDVAEQKQQEVDNNVTEQSNEEVA